MSQQAPPVFITRCEVCIGRSTWDFLQDFYLRVETAENYARRLEKDLGEAQTTAHHFYAALAQCETSLSTSWDILNEERLHHRASREALAFERGRHKETIELLERILKEAIRSGEVADILSSRLTTASNLAACQTGPRFEDSMKETSPNEKTITESIPNSLGQRNESTQRLLLSSSAPGSHQLGEHESQTATRVCGTETSNNHQKNCSRSAHSLSSTTSRTQNIVGGTESVQVAESRRSRKTARESPLRRTQFLGPTQ